MEEKMGYDCCGGTCAPRHFMTKDEKFEMLKEYKDELEQELKGLKERMEEISK